MPPRPDFFYHYQLPAPFDQAWTSTGLETAAAAAAYRAKRIDELRKGTKRHRQLADKLEACGGDEHCLSPACPICARAFRRWILGAAIPMLRDLGELLMVTVIMPQQRASPGDLHALDLKRPLNTLHRQLDRARIPGLVTIGGYDLSLEIDRRRSKDPAWQGHVHMITGRATAIALRQALAPYHPPTSHVLRPMRIDPVRDIPKQVSYCFKNLHRCRVRYYDSHDVPRTKYHPLRSHEARELWRYLDRYTYGDLLLLKGVRRFGNELRLLR